MIFNKNSQFTNKLLQSVSFLHQIEIVMLLDPRKVFEIGIGNKFFSNYLHTINIDINTGDFDSFKKPDIIMDIRNIPLNDNTYEIVVAFEILEHLPWSEFSHCLKELHRISQHYVVISLPYQSLEFELILKIPYLSKFLSNSVIDLFFRIPSFFSTIKPNSEHKWEIGRKGYPLKKIRKEINNYFFIIQEIRPILHGYHYFFILTPKKFENNS